jgi:hypothetical protein
MTLKEKTSVSQERTPGERRKAKIQEFEDSDDTEGEDECEPKKKKQTVKLKKSPLKLKRPTPKCVSKQPQVWP